MIPAVLVTTTLAGEERHTAVRSDRDGDDWVTPIAEGSPAHHDLIYTPDAVLEHATGSVAGEVEMTTAGAVELAERLGAGPGNWLVVRLVPTPAA